VEGDGDKGVQEEGLPDQGLLLPAAGEQQAQQQKTGQELSHRFSLRRRCGAGIIDTGNAPRRQPGGYSNSIHEIHGLARGRRTMGRHRNDLLLALAVLALAAAVWLFTHPGDSGAWAVVTVDGAELGRYALD